MLVKADVISQSLETNWRDGSSCLSEKIRGIAYETCTSHFWNMLHLKHLIPWEQKQYNFPQSLPPFRHRTYTAGKVWLVTFRRTILHFFFQRQTLIQTYTDWKKKPTYLLKSHRPTTVFNHRYKDNWKKKRGISSEIAHLLIHVGNGGNRNRHVLIFSLFVQNVTQWSALCDCKHSMEKYARGSHWASLNSGRLGLANSSLSTRLFVVCMTYKNENAVCGNISNYRWLVDFGLMQGGRNFLTEQYQKPCRIVPLWNC